MPHAMLHRCADNGAPYDPMRQERHPFEELVPSKTSILADFAGIAGCTQLHLDPCSAPLFDVLIEKPHVAAPLCAALQRSCSRRVAGRRSPHQSVDPTVAAVLSPAYAGTNAAHLRMQLMPVYGDRPTGAGVVWPATSAATRKDAINRALDLRTRASRCTHLRRRHVHQHKYH